MFQNWIIKVNEKMKQIPPPTISSVGDWIKFKKYPQPCDTPTLSLSPAVNLRTNHSPPSEGSEEALIPILLSGKGRGQALKKPPTFTLMAVFKQLIKHYL
jgi:hypothetical protein